MSKLRSISTSFWSDPFIEELTPEEKLLYIYLITNEKTNMLGIYELSIRKISFETGIDIGMVEKALKGFECIGKVKYIQNHIVLVNFLKHQNFNTNMKKSAIKIFNSLPNYLKGNILHLDDSNPSKAFETLSKHLGMVRKIEVEDELEIEDEDEKKNAIIDPDAYLSLETCKRNYLDDKKIVLAVAKNKQNKISAEEIPKRLNEFNLILTERGEHAKTQKDYNAHFLSWHKKTKPLQSSKAVKSKVTKYD